MAVGGGRRSREACVGMKASGFGEGHDGNVCAEMRTVAYKTHLGSRQSCLSSPRAQLDISQKSSFLCL